MKKIIVLQALLVYSFNCFCQLNASFQADTIIVERDKQMSNTVYLPVSIKSLNQPEVTPDTISFNVNPAPSTSMTANDYVFSMTSVTVVQGVSQIECPVTIMRGENTAGATLFVSIHMSYRSTVPESKNVVLKIINKKDSDKESKDDLDVSLLIGSNLDFFNSVKLKDLAGEFNIFLPKIFTIKLNSNWKNGVNMGANLGIYNYRNFTVDSPGVVSSVNYKLVPFEALDPTKKIVKATYSTTGKLTKDFQGFYFEPIFSPEKRENKKTQFYLSFHLEILKRTEKIEFDNPNFLWRDTVLYNPQRDDVVKEHQDIIHQNPSSTYYSSFYGIGIPITVSKKYFELLFAPTLGYSEFTTATYQTKGGSFYTIKDKGAFYLCKFFFKEKVSLLGLTLGGEVRGMFGKLNPYLNAYVATRISLSKFAEFFKAAK
jgi:hypothetical protein